MRNNRDNSRSSSKSNTKGKSNVQGRKQSGTNSNGNRSNHSSKGGRGKQLQKADKFEMFTFGTAYGEWKEDSRGNEAFKLTIKLKIDKDGDSNCQDYEGNLYEHEQAVQVLAAALLEGRGINCWLYEKDYPDQFGSTHGGNARISAVDIEMPEALDAEDDEEADEEDDEDEEPAPAKKKQTKSKTSSAKSSSRSTTAKKRKYEEEIADDEAEESDTDDDIEDEDTEAIPF